MNTRLPLSAGSILVLLSVAACSDLAPVTPLPVPTALSMTAFSSSDLSDEQVVVSPVIDEANARLAALGASARIAKAELRLSNGWNGEGPTILVSKDRAAKGLPEQWVPGDPRRNRRLGLTYAFGSSRPLRPYVSNADLTDIHVATLAELDAHIEDGMAAWRDQACSSAPVTRVAPGANPDFLDDFLLGSSQDLANYSQPSDIVQSGWQPLEFFNRLVGEELAFYVVGITITFIFVDRNGVPTDIDRNGRYDSAVAEVYYNSGFVPATSTTPASFWPWSSSGVFSLALIDFFSIVAHESGHAFGLAHMGKSFIQKKDLGDGLQQADIQYAPYALMNAIYFAGRNELATLDRTQFCWIWQN